MSSTIERSWSAEDVLALGRGYQPAAVLAAAADLDLFTPLAVKPRTATDLARVLSADQRGLTILLDALVAIDLLVKTGQEYRVTPGVAHALTADGPGSVLSMAQHQANCMRNWAQLAATIKAGQRPDSIPSIRGPSGDNESFIGSMHNVSAPHAGEVIQVVQPLAFEHLLDVGGASGTWTMVFLRACPGGRATLFDLPEVIPLAERRLKAEGFAERVTLVKGDYLKDALPTGVDLAWVSAIVHQNSRAQNVELFRKVREALRPGGRIAIRDIIMEPDRTRPVAGALFAVNMLAGTAAGGTFTFEETREDLERAGFANVRVARQDGTMNSIVVATRCS